MKGKEVDSEEEEEGNTVVHQGLEDVTSRREFADTENVVQRRNIFQEEVNGVWKELCGEVSRGGPGEVQKWRRRRKVHTKEVVSRWDGESSKKRKAATSLGNVVKIASWFREQQYASK